jgi:septum formation topological specificity factor MinE
MEDKNKNENAEKIRKRILSLIDSEFESDAAFERALGLKDKTVNNWRRGRSASYMKMLPVLSERFHVNISELLDIPLRKDTSELSEEELHLLLTYRRSRTMPPKLRTALRETLENVINLYIKSAAEIKNAERAKRKKQKGGGAE